MLVCALGDLTLDVLVRLPAAIAVGADTEAEIRLTPGGQAANVAAWASALGATARFVGKQGDDAPGRLARAGLEAHGVEVVGPVAGRNAVVCSLVTPDGERSMASDRGASAQLREDELDPAWLDGCEHLFVSGYALVREPSRRAARRAVDLARAAGAAVSVDLSSWIAIRDVGADVFRDCPRRARAGRRVRERGRGARARRSRSPARRGSSSAARVAAPSTVSSGPRYPSRRRSTPPGRAMPSRRAGSWAGPTSRSRRRPAAWRD